MDDAAEVQAAAEVAFQETFEEAVAEGLTQEEVGLQ